MSSRYGFKWLQSGSFGPDIVETIMTFSGLNLTTFGKFCIMKSPHLHCIDCDQMAETSRCSA